MSLVEISGKVEELLVDGSVGFYISSKRDDSGFCGILFRLGSKNGICLRSNTKFSCILIY